MREGGGIATGIGFAVFFYLLLLPLLLVVFLYAFFSIYAMTKGSAFGAATINNDIITTQDLLLLSARFLKNELSS